MYEYFKGLITSVKPGYVVLEVQGIGYQVYVANPFRYQINEACQLYIYQAVRENAITLYGFSDELEKALFLKLLSVSGIGPKSALAILAAGDHQNLVQAINHDQVKYLVKFPGIGKKTAQQIILDLKGKLDDWDTASVTIAKAVHPAINEYLAECLLALSALGYTPTEIKKVEKKLQSFAGNSTDEYLKAALKLIMQ